MQHMNVQREHVESPHPIEVATLPPRRRSEVARRSVAPDLVVVGNSLLLYTSIIISDVGVRGFSLKFLKKKLKPQHSSTRELLKKYESIQKDSYNRTRTIR